MFVKFAILCKMWYNKNQIPNGTIKNKWAISSQVLYGRKGFIMKINHNSELYTNCVFLGGTCANSTWRTDLISKLKDSVPYFDPQVPDWTPEDAEREDACKPVAGINVFVITGEALGTYSGFEICEEAHRAPEKLVFATVGELPENQVKGIGKIKKALIAKGCRVCETLDEIAEIINQAY